MTTHFEDIIRQNSQRLDDLKKTTEELQRELSEARVSLERELARSPHDHAALTEQMRAYPGPGREAFSAHAPVPAQGRYAEDPLPYYAEDSQTYYAVDEPPFVGEGPRYETGAVISGARVPAGDFGASASVASDAAPFDGTSVVSTAFGSAVFDSAASDFTASDPTASDPTASDPSASDPTVGIVSHGRRSAYHRRLSRRTIIAISGATVALVTVLVVIITSGGASWPASVATVQAQVVKACQNPDVVSEPGQVNFACAKATRQVLWVFALLTSNDNPRFADTKTGRQGLEPITPTQGGAVAASLNLHHPYDPANPIDSIAVAARAINDIIGGATLTGTDGNPVVQPGLESHSGNCLRYTGSGLVTSRQGFPDLCARPVTSTHGQMELVADIYRKWIVGASAGAAHDAAVLFANAENPGDSQVQAILRQLGNETLAA